MASPAGNCSLNPLVLWAHHWSPHPFLCHWATQHQKPRPTLAPSPNHPGALMVCWWPLVTQQYHLCFFLVSGLLHHWPWSDKYQILQVPATLQSSHCPLRTGLDHMHREQGEQQEGKSSQFSNPPEPLLLPPLQVSWPALPGPWASLTKWPRSWVAAFWKCGIILLHMLHPNHRQERK